MKLYHATYQKYLPNILRCGLVPREPYETSSYEGQTYQHGVYLAYDENVAEDFANCADNIPNEISDHVVVLEIDATKLNPDKIHADENVLPDEDDPDKIISVCYDGVIPPEAISVLYETNP